MLIATRMRPKCSSLCCSGVVSSLSSCTMCAIFPISVDMPVATTIPFPCPLVTTVPMKTMLRLSPKPTALGRTSCASFDTGRDSPVRIDSSASSRRVSMSLASAAILVPTSIIRMSPGTMSHALTSRGTPSLMTFAEGAASCLRASRDRSARYSCMNPKKALRITIAIIVTESPTSPRTRDDTAAAQRTATIKSLNWFMRI